MTHNHGTGDPGSSRAACQGDTGDQAHIYVMLSLLEQIRAIDPEFPLHYAICLGEIALDEGMSLTALAGKTGLALPTVSRIAGALSAYRGNGRPYGLVTMRPGSLERRRKHLYLTPKARAFFSDLRNVVCNIAQIHD